MSSSIAIWGAITGSIGTITGLGSLGLTAHRDRKNAKRDLLVTHGWQYVYDASGNLLDVWVNVTAFNTGRRPLHVEHIGFETMVLGDRKLAAEAGVELPPENSVWVQQRFEIALNGETLEVLPDGRSVKVWTRLLPICEHAIDPTRTLFRGYVVSWPETFWWEREPAPLLARPSPVHRTTDEVGEAIAHLFLEHMGDRPMPPPADLPGAVVGLQRLILDGDTERTSDLFPNINLRDEPT